MSGNPLAFDDYGAETVGDIDDDQADVAYEEGRKAAIDHWNPFKAPENPYPPTDARVHHWALGFRNETDK